ncbi:MAG: BrnA antitoxin family protein [Alphaproteobacteria bacterium]|nr:BrnA antitoxin family protein [Alphaproteobacteria bacterium]
MARDPDAVMLDEDWLRRAKVVIPPKKQMVALRLDADIVAWLRDSGKGYQTRINALLRAVMDGRLVPK